MFEAPITAASHEVEFVVVCGVFVHGCWRPQLAQRVMKSSFDFARPQSESCFDFSRSQLPQRVMKSSLWCVFLVVVQGCWRPQLPQRVMKSSFDCSRPQSESWFDFSKPQLPQRVTKSSVFVCSRLLDAQITTASHEVEFWLSEGPQRIMF